MKTYIWSYEATTHNGSGTLKGRIEAPNGFKAQLAVKDNNLMINNVKVKLIKNQEQARKSNYETNGIFSA